MTETTTAPLSVAEVSARADEVLDRVEQAVVGKREALTLVLTSVLSRGHVLLEDFPGLGKTLAARSFAQTLGLDFTRAQFTPDLLPSDLTGSFVYDQKVSEFAFRPGPLFTGLLLADEINRTPPKTQSALLEAMQEHQVTVEGQTFPLPQPFHVLATANPVEYEGTYPLPEAQLDRFLFKVLIDRPDQATLRRILESTTGRDQPEVVQVFNRQEMIELQTLLRAVPIADSALDWVVSLIEASHQHGMLRLGASPRGAQAITLAAKGYALAAGRPNVELEDLRRAALPALRHRLLLNFEAEVEGISTDDVVNELLEASSSTRRRR